MSEPIKLRTPLCDSDVLALKAGDAVLISGDLIAARDAAHQRLTELIARGEPLPVDLRGQVIYYVGPTPAPPGRPIGSAGPTTAVRMDAYSPALLALGLKGMIGKGRRTPALIETLKEHKAVYFAAVGGVAALLSERIRAVAVVAYEDLGTEAIRRMTVEDFPAIVINDCFGGDFYEQGVARWRKE
ncbi:MAG: Fe-S-containing hydro-lyase [Armatimonadetes bacterium]|nr:Fe-S-containing hydro-lyase [Armatimonadota bacterium]